jgi:hypothetical protein
MADFATGLDTGTANPSYLVPCDMNLSKLLAFSSSEPSLAPEWIDTNFMTPPSRYA